MATDAFSALTLPQCDAIIELGSRGAGGSFDQMALSELFAMGLVEVRNADRRVALTERGQAVFTALVKSPSSSPDAPPEAS